MVDFKSFLTLFFIFTFTLLSCSQDESSTGRKSLISEEASQSTAPAPIKMTSLSITVQDVQAGTTDVTVLDALGNILVAGQTLNNQILTLSFPLEKDKEVILQSKKDNLIQKTVILAHAGESENKNQAEINKASTLAYFFVKELGNGDAAAVARLKDLLEHFSNQGVINQACQEMNQEEETYVALPQIFEHLESIDTSTSE